MIPRDYITEWRASAPWVPDWQVEQDLVISRALVDIFTHPLLARSLAFFELSLAAAALAAFSSIALASEGCSSRYRDTCE